MVFVVSVGAFKLPEGFCAQLCTVMLLRMDSELARFMTAVLHVFVCISGKHWRGVLKEWIIRF
jgi:hypothetical protein